MIAHLFYYRWPRNKIDLIHEEQETFIVETINAKEGTHIFCEGKWYLRVHKGTDRAKVIAHQPIPPDRVPNEIRALALITTG